LHNRNDLDRRRVVKAVAATAALSVVPRTFAKDGHPFTEPLYFQAAAVRDECVKDLPGTLRALRQMGYVGTEFLYLPGFKSLPRADFGPLAATPPAQLRRILTDAGVACDSCHFQAENFSNTSFPEAIDWAREMQLKYLVITELPSPKSSQDWHQIYDTLNRVGEKVRKEGFLLAYHTDFPAGIRCDGKIPLDEMLRAVPREIMTHELDCAAFVSTGLDPAKYLRRYHGRFFAIHLRDGIKPETPGKYVNAVPFGTGILNFNDIIQAARQAGVRRYIVEMQVRPLSGAMQAYKSGYECLRKLDL